MAYLVHPELSYQVVGILYEAHNEVSRFSSEQEIGDIIALRLKIVGIPFVREFNLQPIHRGEHNGRHRVDFLIEDKIVLEIKTKKFLTKEDYYQVQRYLKHLNLKLGILVNFRDERLHPKRILNSVGKE